MYTAKPQDTALPYSFGFEVTVMLPYPAQDTSSNTVISVLVVFIEIRCVTQKVGFLPNENLFKPVGSGYNVIIR